MVVKRYNWGQEEDEGFSGSADKISYDPATSGLPADDVQEAIDDVDAEEDATDAEVTVLDAEVNALDASTVKKTTAALTYYVRADGNDSHTGLVDSAAGALLTIQAAVNKVPKFALHNVTINIGAGNFAGFNLAGFVVPRGAVFTVQGTLGNPTLTGGTVSGTADGGDTTHCNHSTQTWTINELRGKLLKIGSEYRVVRENTANTMEVVGPFSATCSGKAYELFEQKTVTNSDGPISGVRIYASGNRCTRESILLSDIKATGGSWAFYNRTGDGFNIRRGYFSSATSSGCVLQSMTGEAIIEDCYFAENTSNGLSTIEISGQVRMWRVYAYHNNIGIFAVGPGSFPSTNTDLYVDNSISAFGGIYCTSAVEFFGTRVFLKSNAGAGGQFVGNHYVYLNLVTSESNTGDGLILGGGTVRINGATISGNGGYGIYAGKAISTTGDPEAAFGIAKLYGTAVIQNNISGGIQVIRDYRMVLLDVTGAGNGTYGLTLERGASAEITSATAVTGTSGNATIDGGSTILSYATDFANNGDRVINASNGCIMERKD